MSADDLKQRFRDAGKRPPVAHDIPGVGTVYFRAMSAYESEVMRKKQEGFPKDDGLASARIAAFVICDESGALVFNPENDEDVRAVADIPQGTLGTILRIAGDLSNPKA
jgi:hypothetical protein